MNKNKQSTVSKKITPKKFSNQSLIILQTSQQKNRSNSFKHKNSVNSLHTRSQSKNNNKQNSSKKQLNHNRFHDNSIQKQYAKETYSRAQQRLNICAKMQQLINQIKQRQAKLHSFFQIYKILEEQIGQQRCLQHNNDLSLYCLNQNKALCVYCIYGVNKHKTHKVLPLKDCAKQIANDLKQLQRNIQFNSSQIKSLIRTTENNQKTIQKKFTLQLQQIEKQYNFKLAQIQKDYAERKSHCNEYYQQIIVKNSELIAKLKNFDKNLNFKLSALKNPSNSQSKMNFEVKEVSRQTILTKISELTNVQSITIQMFSSKDLGQSCIRNKIKKTSNV